MTLKRRGLIISSFLIIIFSLSLFIPNQAQSSTSSWNWEVASGLNILIVTGNAFYSDVTTMDTFKEVYGEAGTSVTVVESYDFTNFDQSNYNALLISAIEGTHWFNAAELAEIAIWFNSGDKLLWIAGNSDYGGFYQSNSTSNPVLEAVKSNLRIDGGAIEDPQSSDGSAYRVIANESGVSSPLTDYIAGDFVSTIFHGPTAINFYDYATSEYKDLRNQNIGSYDIDIILNSSAAANALDQDASIQPWDYYPWSNNGIYGNFPMLATQQINGSIVVASGEVIFSSYKFMYGFTYEKTLTTHDGAKVVDKLLDYWFIELNHAPNAILVERPFLTSVSTTTLTTGTSTVFSTITRSETYTETHTETYTEKYSEGNNSLISPQIQVGSISLLGYTLIGLCSIVTIYRKKY